MFVYDTQTGVEKRIYHDWEGNPIDTYPPYYRPDMSGDARFVAFGSLLDNLVETDNNNSLDVFVRDLALGTNRRISISSDNEPGNSNSWSPRISYEGNVVVFISQATNLVPEETNGDWLVFLHDLQSNTTELVSVSPSTGGQFYGMNAQQPYVSEEGRYVAFAMNRTSLSHSDPNGIYVRDRVAGTTTPMPLAGQLYGMSNDGRFLLIYNSAGLVRLDQFTYERSVVDTRSLGQPMEGYTQEYLSLSSDGSHVAITFDDLDLEGYNIFVKNVQQINGLVVDVNHDGILDINDERFERYPGAIMLAGWGLDNHPELKQRIRIWLDFPTERRGTDLTLACSNGDVTFYSSETSTTPLNGAALEFGAGNPIPENLYAQFNMDGVASIWLEDSEGEIVDELKITFLSNGLGVPDPAAASIEVVPGHAFVDAMSGNLHFHSIAKSHSTSSGGPDLAVYYNSNDGFSTRLGKGWRTNFDMRLFESTPDRDGSHHIDNSDRRVAGDYNGDGVEEPADFLALVDQTGRRLVFVWDGTRFVADPVTGLIGAEIRTYPNTTSNSPYQLLGFDNRFFRFYTDGSLMEIADVHEKRFYVYRSDGMTDSVREALPMDDVRWIHISDIGTRDDLNGYELANWHFTYEPEPDDPDALWLNRMTGIEIRDDAGYGAFSHGSTSLSWTIKYDNDGTDINKVTRVIPPVVSENGTVRNGETDENYRYDFTYTPNTFMAASTSTTVQGPYGMTTTYSINPTSDALDGDVTVSDGASTYTTTYTLDEEKRRITKIETGDRSVTMEYEDPYGRMTRYQESEGVDRSFAYDDGGCGDGAWLLKSVTNASPGGTTSYTYWTEGKKKGKIKQINSPRTSWEDDVAIDYNANGFVETVKKRLESGQVATWTVTAWDAYGSPTSITTPALNNTGVTQVITQTHTPEGRLLSSTDIWGLTTTYEYDKLGRMKLLDPPGNGSVTSSFDALGRMISQSDLLGNSSTSTHDAWGRIVKAAIPTQDDTVMTYEFDAGAKRLVVETVKKSGETVTAHEGKQWLDVFGNVRKSMVKRVLTRDAQPTECFTDYQYTSGEGWLWKVSNPYSSGSASKWTVYDYYKSGRQKSMTTPEGAVTLWDWYTPGWLKWVQGPDDSSSSRTEYEYYADGLQKKVTNPKGGSVSTEYYGDGRTKQITPSLGSGVSMAYYPGGLLKQQTDVYGKDTVMDYDFAAKTMTRVYDGLADRTVTQYIDGASGFVNQVDTPFGTVKHTAIDADGVPTSTQLLDGATELATSSITRHALGPVIGTSVARTATNNITTSTQLGSRMQVTESTSASGNVTTPEFEANSQIDEVKQVQDSLSSASNGLITILKRDAAGNVLEYKDAEGRDKVVLEYDDDYRIRKITGSDQQVVQVLEFTPGGRPKRVARTNAAGTYSTATDYDYNELGQMKKETQMGDSPNEWEYDEFGKLTKQTIDAEVVEYEYYDADQQLEWQNFVTKNKKVHTITDEYGRTDRMEVIHGNSAPKLLADYDYNDRNELVRFEYADGKYEAFKYCLTGELEWKKERNGKWIHHVYDKAGILTQREYHASTGTDDPPVDGAAPEHIELVEINNAGVLTALDMDGERVEFPTDVRNRFRGMVAAGNSVSIDYNNANEMTTVKKGDDVVRNVNRDSGTGQIQNISGAALMAIGHDPDRGYINAQSFAGGVSRSIVKDDFMRDVTIEQTIPGVGAQTQGITYTPANQIDVIESEGPTANDDYELEFTYNPDRTLAAEVRTGDKPYVREYYFNPDRTRREAVFIDAPTISDVIETFTASALPANATIVGDSEAQAWYAPDGRLLGDATGNSTEPQARIAFDFPAHLPGICVTLYPDLSGGTSDPDRLAELQAQKQQLEADIAQTQASKTQAQQDLAALQAQRTQLVQELTALQTQLAQEQAQLPQVQTDLDAAEAQLASLQTDYADIEALLQQLNADRDALDAQRSTAIADRDALDAQRSALVTQRDQIAQDIADLQTLRQTKATQHDVLQAGLDQLNADIAIQQAAIAQLNQDIATQQAIVDGIAADLNAAEADRQTLVDALTSLQAQLAQLNSELATLQQALATVQQDRAALIAQRDSAMAQLASTQAQYDNLLAAKQDLLDQYNALLAQRDQLTQDIASINAQIQALETESADLQTERSALVTERDELVTQIRDLTRNAAKLLRDITRLRVERMLIDIRIRVNNTRLTILHRLLERARNPRRIARLQAQIAELEAQNAIFEEEAEIIDAQIEEKQDELAQATDAISQATERIEDIRARMLEIDNRLAEIPAELAAAQQTLTETQAQLDQVNQDIAAIEPQTQDVLTQLAALQTQIDALSAQIAVLDGQIAQLDAQIAQLNADITDKQAAISAAEAQITATQAQIADADAEIAALTQELSDAQATLDTLNTQLADAEAALALLQAQAADKQTQITQLDTDIAELDTQIAAAQTNLADLDTQIADLDTQIAAINQQITDLDTQIANVDAQIATATAALNDLAAAVVQAQAAVNTLQAQKAAVLQQIANTQAAVSSKQDAIAAIDTQITAVNQAIANFDAQLIALNDQLAIVQAEIDDILNGGSAPTAPYLAGISSQVRSDHDGDDVKETYRYFGALYIEYDDTEETYMRQLRLYRIQETAAGDEAPVLLAQGELGPIDSLAGPSHSAPILKLSTGNTGASLYIQNDPGVRPISYADDYFQLRTNTVSLEIHGLEAGTTVSAGFDDLTVTTVTGGGTRIFEYTYYPNGMNQLHTVTGDDGSYHEINYTDNGDFNTRTVVPPDDAADATPYTIDYQYDHLDRLTVITHTYDGETYPFEAHLFTYYASTWMRKTATLKTRPEGTGDVDPTVTETTTQVWDGTNCISQTTGTTTTVYAHFGSQPIWSATEGSPVRQHLVDSLGSNVGSYDAANGLTNQRVWDTNGNLVDGAKDNVHYDTIGYRGQLHDKSGLLYQRHRYMDPSLGMFTQIDPIQDGQNWYRYTEGDTANAWDPTGLDDGRVSGHPSGAHIVDGYGATFKDEMKLEWYYIKTMWNGWCGASEAFCRQTGKVAKGTCELGVGIVSLPYTTGNLLHDNIAVFLPGIWGDPVTGWGKYVQRSNDGLLKIEGKFLWQVSGGAQGEAVSTAFLKGLETGNWDSYQEESGRLLPELLLLWYGEKRAQKYREVDKMFRKARKMEKAAQTQAQKTEARQAYEQAWEEYVRVRSGGTKVERKGQDGRVELEIDSVNSQKAIEAKTVNPEGTTRNWLKSKSARGQRSRLREFAEENKLDPTYWIDNKGVPPERLAELERGGMNIVVGKSMDPYTVFLMMLFAENAEEKEEE